MPGERLARACQVTVGQLIAKLQTLDPALPFTVRKGGKLLRGGALTQSRAAAVFDVSGATYDTVDSLPEFQPQ